MSRRLAVLVAVVALALPLLASVRYVRDVSRPGTGDRAIDWAAAALPEGARVLTRLDLGLDESRVEVFKVPRLDQRAAGAGVGLRLRHPSRRSRRRSPASSRWRRSSPAAATTARRSPPASVPDALRPRRRGDPAGRRHAHRPRPARRRSRPRSTATPTRGGTPTRSSRRGTSSPSSWAARSISPGSSSGSTGEPPLRRPRAAAGGPSRADPGRRPPWVHGRTRPEDQRLPASQVLLLLRPVRGGRGPPGPHPERGPPLGHRGACDVA